MASLLLPPTLTAQSEASSENSLPGEAEMPVVANAEESPPSPEPQEAESEEEGEGEAKAPNPCRIPNVEGAQWLDSVQRGIFLSVCSSARWFDGFFGDARYDEEADKTWGRLAVDTIWDRVDDFDAKVRFRAEFALPNLDQRVDAFFGRENEEDFISDRNESIEVLPEFFSDDQEREWLAGLGYRPVSTSKRRLDFQVGVKVRFPLEPFVQGRYRRYWLLGNTRLARLRNTVFWRNQRGFGNTLSLDVEQALGPYNLIRWTSSGTFSEDTEGVDWNSSLTLYQSLDQTSAIAWILFVDGEADAEVPLERYGLRGIYRRQMLRDWFFGQVIAGANWPREFGNERETSWEVGVGFEIRYGSEPKRR